VVSPGSGGAVSSSATFCRSSPNDRRASGAATQGLGVLQALTDECIGFAKYFLKDGCGEPHFTTPGPDCQAPRPELHVGSRNRGGGAPAAGPTQRRGCRLSFG
jgi:hypothetical protein